MSVAERPDLVEMVIDGEIKRLLNLGPHGLGVVAGLLMRVTRLDKNAHLIDGIELMKYRLLLILFDSLLNYVGL